MARQYRTGIVITGDAKGGVRAINLTKEELEKLNKKTRNVSKSGATAFDDLAASIQRVGVVAGGAALAAITALTAQMVTSINATRRYAEALNIPIEQLSAMEYAVADAGIGAEKLGDILKDTAEKISDAYMTGGGEAAEALKALGISARDLVALNPADQLLMIATELDKIGVQGAKVKILEDLANDASLLLPLLDDNAKALRDMMNTAEQRGYVITQEEADIAQEVAQNFRDFEKTIETLTRAFARDLLPSINNVIRGLTRIMNNGVWDFISDRIDEWRVTAEWFAAWDAGQIGFVEWFSAGPDEAKQRLSELKAEMDGVTGAAAPMVIEINRGSVAFEDFAVSNKGATDKLRDMRAETEKFQRELRNLLESLDPAKRAAREYAQNVELITRAQREGLISGKEHFELITQIGEAWYASSEAGLAAAKATEAAARAQDEMDQATLAAARAAADEWQRTADNIERSLTDALLRGFEDGKGFADNFRNTLLNMFKTLVLRPQIEFLLSPITGALTGISGGVGSLINPISGIANAAGINPFSALSGAISNALLPGSIAGGTAGAFSGLGAASGQLGLGGVLSSALPFIGPALAIGGLFSGLFGGDDPSPHYGAGGGFGQINQNYERDLTGEQQQQVQRIIASLNQVEQQFIDILPDAWREALEGFEPIDYTQVHLESEHEMVAHLITRVGLGIEQLDATLADRWAMAVSDIADERPHSMSMADYESLFNDILAPYIAAMRVAEELNVDQAGAESIISSGGGLESFSRGFAIFNNRFRTEAEKFAELSEDVSEALSELGVDAPGNRAGFAGLVDSLDLTSESGRELYGALIEIVPLMDAFYTMVEQGAGALADATAEQQQMIANLAALQEIMSGVDDIIDRNTLSAMDYSIKQIETWRAETIESAMELGASEEELIKIRQAAALQIDALIEQQQNLNSYQPSAWDVIATSQENFTARIENYNASVQDTIAGLESNLSELDALLNTLIEQYRASLSQAREVVQFAISLTTGDLSPLAPQQQLSAARQTYQSALGADYLSDPYLVGDIISAASTYLSESQSFFGSSRAYKDAFNVVYEDLLRVGEDLGGVTGATPAELLSNLDAKLAELEADEMADTISTSLEAIGISKDSTIQEVKTAIEDVETAITLLSDRIIADSMISYALDRWSNVSFTGGDIQSFIDAALSGDVGSFVPSYYTRAANDSAVSQEIRNLRVDIQALIMQNESAVLGASAQREEQIDLQRAALSATMTTPTIMSSISLVNAA